MKYPIKYVKRLESLCFQGVLHILKTVISNLYFLPFEGMPLAERMPSAKDIPLEGRTSNIPPQ